MPVRVRDFLEEEGREVVGSDRFGLTHRVSMRLVRNRIGVGNREAWFAQTGTEMWNDHLASTHVQLIVVLPSDSNVGCFCVRQHSAQPPSLSAQNMACDYWTYLSLRRLCSVGDALFKTSDPESDQLWAYFPRAGSPPARPSLKSPP